MQGEVKLRTLAQEWHGCQRCPLGAERPTDHIVFGSGSPRAKYLFVYEAPTEADVFNGSPMNGLAGKLLDTLLAEAKFPVEHVYCTPVTSCRPIKVQPATEDQPERIIDREASKEELAACRERLQQIVYLVDPMLIFTFGAVAWKSLVINKDRGTFTSLDKAIGELFLTRLSGRFLKEISYDVIPLLSLQQILATPSSAAHGSLSTTVRHLHKGSVYVRFIEKTCQRDAKAAGFEPQDRG